MIPRYYCRRAFICIAVSVPLSVLATAQPLALQGTERQLTFGEQPDQCPAWSPDGTMIAFHSLRFDNRDLWVVPAEGGEPRRLTTHEAEDQHPSWSPDGRQIAFLRYTDDVRQAKSNVCVINVDGTAERQLTRDDTVKSNVKWNRSGQSVVYSELYGSPAGVGVAFVELNVRTKERTLILEDRFGTTLAISPDGRSIAFDSLDESAKRTFLYILDMDDHQVTPIVTDMEERIWFPGWSPDGRWIVFQAGQKQDSAIWLVSPDGKRRAKLPLHGSANRHPAWSPDGRKIAFTKGHESANIWVFEFERMPQ